MITRRRLADRLVAPLGLGAMPLSLEGAPDRRTAINLIQAFIEQGGDFIDTANVYSAGLAPGDNERLIAAALAERDMQDQIWVATKGGVQRTSEGWRVDASPAALQQACEQSLQSLGTERIFLYQLHTPDPAVDIRESVGALKALQRQGKIAHIGLSNVAQTDVDKALAETPIVSVQNKLHLRHQHSRRNGLLHYCRQQGISFIAHSPVGGYHHYQQLAADAELRAIADDYHTTPANLAIAWLLHLADNVLVINGARRIETLQASQAALALSLSAETLQRLNALEDW